MSLVRGLTKRMRLQQDDASWVNSTPTRTFSNRRQEKPFDRTKISLPVELLSSSNQLAYEAPDLKSITPNVDVVSVVIPEQPQSRYAQAQQQQQQPEPQQQQQQISSSSSEVHLSSPTSSASSTKSYADSITSPGLSSASSITSHGDSREASPTLAEHGHLKTFFFDDKEHQRQQQHQQQRQEREQERERVRKTSSEQQRQQTLEAAENKDEVPSIPQRALSHTKRSHLNLARQRSISRSRQSTDRIPVEENSNSNTGSHLSFGSHNSHLSVVPSSSARESRSQQHLSVSSSTAPVQPLAPPSSSTTPATRSSVDMFAAKPAADHPFGAELAKVNELAEEYGVQNVEILDEESKWLIDNGLLRWSADDYMQEIQPLFGYYFGGLPSAVAAGAGTGGWL